MGPPNVLCRMYAEGGARVGDHTSSVLGRVADSQWHWLTIVAAAGEEEKVCTQRNVCQIHRQLSETGY